MKLNRNELALFVIGYLTTAVGAALLLGGLALTVAGPLLMVVALFLDIEGA